MLAMIPHEKTLEDIFLSLTSEDAVYDEAVDEKNEATATAIAEDDTDSEKDNGDDYKPLFG